MARRRGGGQGGASDPAFTGPRSPQSGPPWATPRNRDPLSASAIFSYSPGLTLEPQRCTGPPSQTVVPRRSCGLLEL